MGYVMYRARVVSRDHRAFHDVCWASGRGAVGGGEFRRARSALGTGPWFTAASFPEQGIVSIVVDDDVLPALSVTTATSRRGSLTDLRRVYVAATPEQVRTVEEHHVLGLFTQAEYLEAFELAGFRTEWHADGLSDRGLLVAQLPDTDRERREK